MTEIDEAQAWRERGAGYAGRAAAALNENGGMVTASANALMAIYCELRYGHDVAAGSGERADGRR